MQALLFFLTTILLLVTNYQLPVTSILASHIPAPVGHINDYAGVLSSEQKNSFEQSLSDYQKATGTEIGIAIVKNLNGGEIDDFTVRTFEEWKLGQTGKDNGVLIVAAMEDHKIRIEVGYGLEPYLNDSKAGIIIREKISPKFKTNDYYGGLIDGVEAIKDQLPTDGSTSPLAEARKHPVLGGWIKFLVEAGFIFLFPLLGLLAYGFSYMGRTKSVMAGGLAGIILGGLIGLIFSLLIAVILGTVFGGLGLLLDWLLSRNYLQRTKEHKPTDWWRSGGGFFLGGGGGGGGFGGFGGGSSGGGGASGDW